MKRFVQAFLATCVFAWLLIFMNLTWTIKVPVRLGGVSGETVKWQVPGGAGNRCQWLDHVPVNANWDATTATFSWTPSPDAAAEQELRVRYPGWPIERIYHLELRLREMPAPFALSHEPMPAAAQDQLWQWQVRIDRDKRAPARYWLLDAPLGMTIEERDGAAHLAWKPPRDFPRAASFTIKASSSGRVQRHTFELPVEPMPLAPYFVSSPLTDITGTQPYTYAIVARDPEGEEVRLRLVEGPPGMHIDAETGILHWQAPPEIPARVPIVVEAVDPQGLSTRQSFELQRTDYPLAGSLAENIYYVAELDDGLMAAVTANRIFTFHRDAIDQPLATLAIPDAPWGMESRDGYLFLVHTGMVLIVDARNPYHLQQISQLKAPMGWHRDVNLHGNYIYGNAPLTVVAIQDLAQPRQLSTDDGSRTSALLVREGMLYRVASNTLSIYSLENPGEPKRLAQLGNIDSTCLLIRLPWLYIYGTKTYVINIADPAKPMIEATYDMELRFANFAPLDATRMWVWGQDIALLDFSNPQAPEVVAGPFPMSPSILPSQNALYERRPDGGLKPLTSLEVAEEPLSTSPRFAALHGDWLYAFDDTHLAIYDIRIRSLPRLIRRLAEPPFNQPVQSIAQRDNLLATDRYVLDLSQPTQPRVLRELDATTVHFHAGHLVASSSPTMTFYDPAALSEPVATLDLLYDYHRLVANEQTLYPLCKPDMLRACRFVDGELIYLSEETINVHSFSRMTLGEKTLAISQSGWHYTLFDISDPDVIVQTLHYRSRLWIDLIHNGHAFVSGRMQHIDLRWPTEATRFSSHPQPYAQYMVAEGPWLYVPSRKAGLRIYYLPMMNPD